MNKTVKYILTHVLFAILLIAVVYSVTAKESRTINSLSADKYAVPAGYVAIKKEDLKFIINQINILTGIVDTVVKKCDSGTWLCPSPKQQHI